MTPQARLSDRDFAQRTGVQGTPICSRDVNPIGLPAVRGYSLIVPANAQILIIDTTFGSLIPGVTNLDYNAGLGRFLAVRIRVDDLPQSAINYVLNFYAAKTPPVNLVLESGGYLYIGYAHLDMINPSVATRFETPAGGFSTLGGDVLTKGTIIGTSGNSDADLDGIPSTDENSHLDITVFYLPPNSPSDAFISPDRAIPETAGFPGSPSELPRWYNSFYRIYTARDTYGDTQPIDSLALWPLLAEGVSNVDYIFP